MKMHDLIGGSLAYQYEKNLVKNLRGLIRFAELFPEIRLTIGGLQPQMSNSANIVAIGNVPPKEIAEFYNSINFYVSFSLAETFGQTCLESLAHGVPIVVLRGTAMDELVTHRVTGFICEDLSRESLGMAVDWLQSLNESTYVSCKIAAEKYSPKNIEKLYEIFIEKL